jgi:hypothetical protein
MLNNDKILLMKVLGLKDGPVSRCTHAKFEFGNFWEFLAR